MIDELIERVDAKIAACDREAALVHARATVRVERIETAERKVEAHSAREAELKQAALVISALTNLVYEGATVSLAQVLNYGIQAAYPRDISAVVTKDVSGGRPTLSVGVQDGGKEPINPSSAHGGGLSQLLGFLSRVILVTATNKRRFLLLDEPFSAVSKDLLTDLSSLIQAVVKDLGFQVIMMTHQSQLADSASYVYRLTSPGVLEGGLVHESVDHSSGS